MNRGDLIFDLQFDQPAVNVSFVSCVDLVSNIVFAKERFVRMLQNPQAAMQGKKLGSVLGKQIISVQ
ncbi:hypothetical protein NECAME_08772 [Necator americanus]|uniref:Uncharacterized protein n=1 Tax=Necator americanus TaxID=51031 RepID=W2THE1_NECAM|nr:hypothetical protein NECAME_08772 [Necator americanus]ETN81019.1 hypothetical protein NECAME_08772 [Necator americanus]